MSINIQVSYGQLASALASTVVVLVGGGWGLWAWSYTTGYGEAKDAYEQKAAFAEKQYESVLKAKDWRLPEYLASINSASEELRSFLTEFDGFRMVKNENAALKQEVNALHQEMNSKNDESERKLAAKTLEITQLSKRLGDLTVSNNELSKRIANLNEKLNATLTPSDDITIEEHASRALVPGVLQLGVDSVLPWEVSGLFADKSYKVSSVGQLVGTHQQGSKTCSVRLTKLNLKEPKSAMFSFQCVDSD